MAEAQPLRVVLDERALRNIEETRDVLDGLLETLEILADRDLVVSIRAAEREVRQGKARPVRELFREVGLE